MDQGIVKRVFEVFKADAAAEPGPLTGATR